MNETTPDVAGLSLRQLARQPRVLKQIQPALARADQILGAWFPDPAVVLMLLAVEQGQWVLDPRGLRVGPQDLRVGPRDLQAAAVELEQELVLLFVRPVSAFRLDHLP